MSYFNLAGRVVMVLLALVTSSLVSAASNDEETPSNQDLLQILEQRLMALEVVNDPSGEERRSILSEMERAVNGSGEKIHSLERDLCLVNMKRGVAVVSLALELNKSYGRRVRLVKNIKGRNNASDAERIEGHEKERDKTAAARDAHFRKYVGSLKEVRNCSGKALNRALRAFKQEVAANRMSDFEKNSYELFKQHLDTLLSGGELEINWSGMIR